MILIQMKKQCCIILLLISILFLVSCQNESGLQGAMILDDRDNQLADTCVEEFCLAVQNRNREAVKKAFSNRACAYVGDMKTQIDELFEFLKGEPISWNREESPVVEDVSESGATTKHEMFWFSLKTSEDVYSVFFSCYPMDKIDPDNEGVYSMLILRECDEHKLEGSMNQWSTVPGIQIRW